MHLDVIKLGAANYQVRVKRLAGGFANPIDAEMIGNRIYAIEYGGNQGIEEITFPPAPLSDLVLTTPERSPDGRFGFDVNGATGQDVAIDVSTNQST